MDNLYHLYYSLEQTTKWQRCPKFKLVTPATPDRKPGDIVEITESNVDFIQSQFSDVIYLGTGRLHEGGMLHSYLGHARRKRNALGKY